jgi:hypothetical protein
MSKNYAVKRERARSGQWLLYGLGQWPGEFSFEIHPAVKKALS